METAKRWWDQYPWRMIQTNLREPDMADINVKQYVQDVKDFGATVVMLNAAGIVAGYDTQIREHTRSEYLHGDSLRAIVEECHQSGIRVIARTDFSKIRYPLYEAHPDWAFRTAEGEIFNCNGDVQVCPNSGYQQKIVYEILQELLTVIPFDGIFFNMSGGFVTGYDGTLYGACMCERCRELYCEATGQEPPKGMRDPQFMQYMGFHNRLIQANKRKQYQFIKKIDPDLAVSGFDYQRTECNTDIERPPWLYAASSSARSGGGRRQTVDCASVDFMGFRYRDSSVSPALMELRQWQSLANGGGLSLFIMGRLDNHRDTSGFAPTKKVFDFHRKHEEIFCGLSSAAEVIVVQKGIMARNDPEVYGWIQALTESHVPFDEIKLPELEAEDLQGKKAVIVGNIKNLPEAQASILDEFAAVGGIVIATGDTTKLKCIGVKTLGEHRKGLMSSVFEVRSSDSKAFPRCQEAPLIPFGADLQMAEFEDGTKKYWGLIPEHPCGPPERCWYSEVTDHPGVTVHRYGTGYGIYIPWMIGSFYFNHGWQNTLNVMQDVLFSLCGLPELAPGLTPMVELTLAKKDGLLAVQMVNGTGCFANRWFQPVPVRGIQLELPWLVCSQIRTLNGGTVTAEIVGSRLAVHLDELREYEAIIIE